MHGSLMLEDADKEAAELVGQAVAAAIEAGWTREDFSDNVDGMWTDVQRAFAIFIVQEALDKAMRGS